MQNLRCIIPQFSKNINDKRKSRYITVIDIIIKQYTYLSNKKLQSFLTCYRYNKNSYFSIIHRNRALLYTFHNLIIPQDTCGII